MAASKLSGWEYAVAGAERATAASVGMARKLASYTVPWWQSLLHRSFQTPESLGCAAARASRPGTASAEP